MTSKLIALLILLVLPCMGATITTVDDTHTNLPPNAVTTNETSDVNFQGGFALGGKAFPTNPAAGAMMRYDGTNWLATSGSLYYRRNSSPFDFGNAAVPVTNMTYDATWRWLGVSSIASCSDIPTNATAYHINLFFQDNAVGSTWGADVATNNTVWSVKLYTLVANAGGYYPLTVGATNINGTNGFWYNGASGLDYGDGRIVGYEK